MKWSMLFTDCTLRFNNVVALKLTEWISVTQSFFCAKPNQLKNGFFFNIWSEKTHTFFYVYPSTALTTDYIFYCSVAFLAVKRYNWPGRVVEIEFAIFFGILLGAFILWNWTTAYKCIWWSQLQIRTIGFVFASNWSTANFTDDSDRCTATHCFWVLWHCWR